MLIPESQVRIWLYGPPTDMRKSLDTLAAVDVALSAADEVLACGGTALGPSGVEAHNPVFDVTPAALVDYIVTERGVVLSPNAEKLAAHMAD